ncbi:nuclear lim interactor-interacting factor [Angomonas deanei]|uniref:Mitochondrial import inner membrane translocase subunit TIM50 n=1 Tax=Angomonas deanei TaxID=59799 RepID=S9VG36_9TRYP|nr:nuclear lim interactor-interacting factor [Angomonas deanei]EPY39929.1 nuclear lim interactor-interacting factor [Angomonas deanei]EPY41846.1 nuclear lim interactor-interacting factor [Angomonas deanei]CAD2214668.1 NLI interacting factor-like phosphatase, putative [Angomonas deanei]|eukprot:EPY35973.1 nuclear lim interactor-interacting factor [Angomonas deanei]
MSAAQKQRIRGESFKQEYQGAARRRPNRRRDPSMNKSDTRFVIPVQDAKFDGKLVLVLDLDETLVYARGGPLYARPGLDEFFKLCKDKCVEVVVWTAGLKAYAQAIVENIDKSNAVTHCIYRHSKWFTGLPGYRKDLAALGRPLDKVLIIENTPDCIRGYQDNGILVEDYEGGEYQDNTIYALTEVIHQLCDSQMTVPQFVSSCQLLKRTPIQTDIGDFITVYSLDVHVYDPGTHVRVNRDLQN